MVQIAEAIKLTILDHKLDEAEAIVKGLTSKYPIYEMVQQKFLTTTLFERNKV